MMGGDVCKVNWPDESEGVGESLAKNGLIRSLFDLARFFSFPFESSSSVAFCASTLSQVYLERRH